MRAALALTPLCLTLLMSSLQQMDAAEGHLLTPPFYTTNEANRVTMFDLNSGAFKTIAETDVLVDVEDLCFLDYYTFLVTSKHNVFMYDVSGEMLGVFASGFGQAYGIVKLSTGDIVVSDKENEVLVKYDAHEQAEHEDGSPEEIKMHVHSLAAFEDASQLIPLEGKPRYMHEGPDGEIIVSVEVSIENEETGEISSEWHVVLVDLLGGQPVQTLLRSTFGLAGMSTLSQDYFVVTSRSSEGAIYTCPLVGPAEGEAPPLITDFCTIEFVVEEDFWDPYNLILEGDALYVTDFSDSSIRVLRISTKEDLGTLGRTGDSNLPSGLAIRPGPYPHNSPAILSSVDAVAGQAIATDIYLRNWHNDSIDWSSPGAVDASRYVVEAVGTRTDPRFGLVTSINVKGSDVVKKPQATSVPTEPMVLSSVITIPFAGEWTIHVTETTPYAQEMMYSPYTVVVVPALTSPPMCQFNFPFAVKAGEIFEGAVTTFDEFENPTYEADGDEIYYLVLPREILLTTNDFSELLSLGAKSMDPSAGVYSFKKIITETKEYNVHVFHRYSPTGTLQELALSPYWITVSPNSFSPSMSVSDLRDIAFNNILANDLQGRSVTFQISPRDNFGNLLTNSNFIIFDVVVEWITNNNPIETVHTDFVSFPFEGSIDIPKQDYGDQGTMLIYIRANNTLIQDSPFTVPIRAIDAPPNTSTTTTIAGIVVFIFFVTIGILLYNRSHMKIEVEELNQWGKAVENRNLRIMEENKMLEEQLQHRKHSPEEIAIMNQVMERQTEDRLNELRGVIVNSSEVTLGNVIGRGGFGTVNLGIFNGQKVAVKQLKDVSEKNVKRFRFECFLLKNLRHPNVVELVGVVWDVSMLACLLEFVSNGTLGEWLYRDGKNTRGDDKLSWKDPLLKVAQQVALGVQYLHHSRYFDEENECWKDQIIHRDLKPSNLLLTDQFNMKLSDFGESRALDADITMTVTGTPIYMAPEIIKRERYDSKVDVYSFGICLVAMCKLAKSVTEFFFAGIKKELSQNGSGFGAVSLEHLNYHLVQKNWRPRLPRSVPSSIRRLIDDCWSESPLVRPTFDEIVGRLNGDVADQIRVAGKRRPSFPLTEDMSNSNRENKGDKKDLGSDNNENPHIEIHKMESVFVERVKTLEENQRELMEQLKFFKQEAKKHGGSREYVRNPPYPTTSKSNSEISKD